MSLRRTDARRWAHIDRGERAYLPLGRMRRIRWEEAVVRALAKRAGLVDVWVTHSSCSCGYIECQGLPHAQGTKARRRVR